MSSRLLFKSFGDFFKDGGIMHAGSLSFFTMMAIVPFCLFLVTIFGHFLGVARETYQPILLRLMNFFPTATHEVTEELKKLIAYRNLGTFTLVLYGFLSYQLFSSLETSANAIFKIKSKRPFISSVILSLTVITLFISFLLISFAAASSVSLLKPVMQEFFPRLTVSKVTRLLVGYLIPLILSWMTIAALYVLLPKKKIRISHACYGALFTSVFLEIAKHLFSFYISHVFRFGAVYGPLSAFVIFLLWVFYSSCIFLIGAEVVQNLGSPGRK